MRSQTLGQEVDVPGWSRGAGGGGGEEAGLGRGRGDTSQSWILGGRAISPSPWTGRCLGSWSLEQVGLAPEQDASPSSTVRDPLSAALRLQIKLAHGFPTRGAQMSPLTGRRCHFVSFWQWGGGPSRVQGCRAALPRTRCPGAPHRGPRDVCAAGWARAEGTILPRSLCKVTLEAAPSRLLHSGPKPTPRTGQFRNP